jgi:hypothetical protein
MVAEEPGKRWVAAASVSLPMVPHECHGAIGKAFGLAAATRRFIVYEDRAMFARGDI